jgi:glycosyltransferase involved in cell wall biosynthesis
MNFVFVGPLTRKITGQRIAFGHLQKLNGDFYDIFQILNALKILFLFNRYKGIYITGSRSYIGFLRDLFFLAPFLILKRKIIIHIHGDDIDNLLNSNILFFRFVSNIVYKRSKLISCNPIQFDHLRDNFDVELVNNFARFDVCDKPKMDKRGFLYLSTVSIEKGIFDWLKFVQLIGRDFNFDIVGNLDLSLDDSTYFFHTIQFLKDSGYKIEFHGPLFEEELSVVMDLNTDIIYLSKHPTENMPLVLLEAASKGMNLHVTTFRGLNLRFGLKTNPIDISVPFEILVKKILNYTSSKYDIEYNRKLILANYTELKYLESVKRIIEL